MKPIKMAGNFMVYEGEARRAAFALESDKRLFENAENLLNAAKEVINNWEHGDLAAAVRLLDETVREIEEDCDNGPVQESEKGGV